MEFLVISQRHGLIPLAHRLRLEGHAVDLIVWKRRFERAWDGKITKLLRGSKGEIQHDSDTMRTVQDHVRQGRAVLLTDVPGLEGFDGTPYKFGVLGGEQEPTSAIRLGGWFTGEALVDPHLLVCDVGAWPGGLGAPVLGGMTLVRPGPQAELGFLEELWRPFLERLKAMDFRGLVGAGLRQSADDGGVRLEGLDAGWPWLQRHAWLSELTNFGGVLLGELPIMEEGSRFTTVLPVTVPPWPVWDAPTREEPVKVEGLTPADMQQVFWHDVVVDEEHRSLRSAGLDGLLGVVRGAAFTPELARARALERAGRLRVPGKQYRPDVGMRVGEVLASLELQFGLRI
jgi:hypothetical protein